MRLKTNDIAPSFSYTTLTETVFDLTLPRQNLLLLSFFRYASCPLCNLRVHHLIQQYASFKDKLDIVAIFQSPKKKILQYVGKQTIPFIVIPDPQKNLYQKYGVENSWLGFMRAWTVEINTVFNAVIKHQFLPGTVEGEINRIPADFIIYPDNKIVYAYYGKDIGDHLPIDKIYELIEKYETG